MTTADIYSKRSRPISLTPLIDVVFILLMFFMLTSSFIHEKQIELATGVSQVSPPSAQAKRLLLLSNGALSMDLNSTSNSVSIETLDKNTSYVVHPAAATNVQTIVRALTQLKQAGLKNISLSRPIPLSDSEVNNHE